MRFTAIDILKFKMQISYYLVMLCLGVAAVAIPVQQIPEKQTKENVPLKSNNEQHKFQADVTEKNIIDNKSIIMRADAGCPDGFVMSELLPQYCYKLVFEGYTWWDAYLNCKVRYGADLAYIQSDEEQTVLESYIKNAELDWTGHKLAHIWIGLTKEGDGPWGWTKPAADMVYQNWAGSGAPANILESCGYMSNFNYLWYDIFCFQNRINIGNGGSGSTSEAIYQFSSLCKAPYQPVT